MPIKGDTALSSFSGKELAESSAIHGDFNQASLNYSGHQNLEVRGAEDMDGRVVNIVGVEDKVYVTIRFPDTNEHYGYDKIFVGEMEDVMLAESFGADECEHPNGWEVIKVLSTDYPVLLEIKCYDCDAQGKVEADINFSSFEPLNAESFGAEGKGRYKYKELTLENLSKDSLLEMIESSKDLITFDGVKEELADIDIWVVDDEEKFGTVGESYQQFIDGFNVSRQSMNLKKLTLENLPKDVLLNMIEGSKDDIIFYGDKEELADREVWGDFDEENFGTLGEYYQEFIDGANRSRQKWPDAYKDQKRKWWDWKAESFAVEAHSKDGGTAGKWKAKGKTVYVDDDTKKKGWTGVAQTTRPTNSTLIVESVNKMRGGTYHAEIDAQENLRLTILSFIDDSWGEEDEEAWRRHLNTYDTDRKKAQVLDKIMAWHDRMQLQSDGIADELDRMEWMLENPDKDYADYDDYADSFNAEYGKRQRFGNRYVGRDTKGKFISNVSVGRSLKADRRSKSKTPARSGFGHKGDSQKGASGKFKLPTDAKSLVGIGAVLGGLWAYLESKA